MAKRILSSLIAALIFCALTFYLAYFVGLMYSAATGPLNPANATGLERHLRTVAVPISAAVGVVTFVLAMLWSPDSKRQRPFAKVIEIRQKISGRR